LTRDRYSHLKNAAKQDAVGTLRTGTVYRRNLNTHVVDDVLWPRPAKGLAERNISCGHHLILSFEWGGVIARWRYMIRTLTNYYTAAEREGIGAQTACAHQGTCLRTG